MEANSELRTVRAPSGPAQDDALPPTSGRSCVSQEAGVPSQTVPGRRLNLMVARERQLCRGCPQFSRQKTSPSWSRRAECQSITCFISCASSLLPEKRWKAHRLHLGITPPWGCLRPDKKTPTAQECSKPGGARSAACGTFHSGPNGILDLPAEGAPGCCRGAIWDDI